MDSLIKVQGPIPQILSLFPKAGLLPDTLRYFRHHIVMNAHYFLSNENILNLGPRTEAALAWYRRGETSAILLLLMYPGPQEADEALKSLIKYYMPEAGKEALVRLENGKWAGAATRDRLLVTVAEADGRAFALDLIHGVIDTETQEKSGSHEAGGG
jgi:hypothetical protein